MNLFKTLAITLLSLSVLTLNAHAVDLQELRAKKLALQVKKQKLEEQIAVSSTQAEIVNEELNFIETYASGELDLFNLIGAYPLVSETSYVAALGIAAKFMDGRILKALSAVETNMLTRLLQRYPKLSRATNGLTAVIAVGIASYYTYKSAKMYAELEKMSADQINAKYASLLNEMNFYRTRVIEATEKLTKVQYELNLVDAEIMKTNY